MANKSNSGEELDLSSLNFGPAWAKEEEKKEDYSKYEVKGKSSGNRQGYKGSGGRSSGGRSQGQKNFRRDGDKRGYDKKPRFTPPSAPEGFTGQIMPIEEGLDRLATQILQTSRTYSVFDLARMVLQARERFNVGLIAPKGVKMFRNTSTASTFLTKEEAVADFWQSEQKAELYNEVKKEVEPPKGNFTSVAKCSKSGVYLGPPNHHDYQKNLQNLHRERFSNVPFEVFQRGVDVLSDEEEVNAWIEQQKYQIFYQPKSEAETLEAASAKAPAETPEQEVVAETPEPEVETETLEANAETLPDEATDATAEETSLEEAPSEEAAELVEEAPQTEAPAMATIDESNLLKDRSELERHFLKNHFNETYKEVQISWVPSAIAGKHLSPGLLTLLKDTISEERRYPGKLSSMMCRQLSGRNVAVFKFNKKLKAGPSRPHALPEFTTLAERPRTILEWSQKNDGKGIDKLWESVLPKEVSEEAKAEWFHDLKWLLTQGFLSLLEDGKLFYSKKEAHQEEPKKSSPKPKKAAKATKEAKADEKEEPKAETPASDSKEESA